MSISSNNQPSGASQPEVADAVLRLTGRVVVRFETLGGGRNSRVYRAVLNDGGSVAVKCYGFNPDDPRDRLGTEFGSLRFLWRHGVRQIPEPLAADPPARIGVYEYIPGPSALASGISADMLRSAIALLDGLRTLAGTHGLEWTGLASEACFSFAAVVEGIRRRLDRLREGHRGGPSASDMAAFLRAKVGPLLDDVVKRGASQLAAARIAPDDVLPVHRRTLSPSDFGFHNAIARMAGELVFVDFEYFGWDDPAKTVSDFLLHPAMALPDDLRRIVTKEAGAVFGSDPTYRVRLGAYYPLFGIKWCLILLNEFLPESLVRRRHAGVADGDLDDLRRTQLSKAEHMLCRVSHDYESLPDGPIQ